MSDIKELLEIYVATANSGKYKTFDEVNSKFPELKDYDKAILEEYVATANSGKYKTFDEVNSKFPEFFDVSVKKKAESGSSLDISAGPYASGQKPKGFGDIVSEKISEVSPQEEKQIKIKQEKAPQQPKQVQKTTTDSYGQQAMDALGSGIISTMDALALGGLHAIDIILPTGSEIGENETINKAVSKIKEANVSAAQESKDRESLLPYNGSPSDAFMAGDWGKVAKLTGLKVLNSIPTSVAMGLDPSIAATWAIGNVSNEYSKLKKEGYSDTQAAVDASINTSSEILVDRLFGGAKQIKTLFAQGGKEAVRSAIKKKLVLELGKTAVENIGGEQIENLTSNLSKKYVLGKKDQDLLEGAGDTFFTSFGTSALYSPLTIINTAKNNLIAKEQAKEGTLTISEEQQAQLSLSKPNRPELPPDAGGGGMPQAQSESQNQPLTQEENAVQIESTSSEVPPIGETGQIIPQGSEGVRQGEQGIETTQQGGQEEIGIISDALNELQQNNVLLTINDIPVSIQVTNEGIVATDLETGDSVLVNSDDVLVDGQYPLTDVINEHIGQSEQQQQQQQAPPIELPKKIFHATKASFEGLPSRQEQSKVSAFGTEPAGTFYSTNPDRAKQAIGDGGDARIIEADFNPKNPLVIENTDNEVYSNIRNESEQQAIQELNDKYIESGVDLTTLEEGELPEEVNKRTTEIFADKLKEQGYDAVINNENGDIIVLDDTVVTEKKAEPKAAPTNEIEKSQQIQGLKDELNALDAQDDSKLSEKERKRIKNAIRYTVTSIARGYFLDGGKILWDSLKKETGFKGGEFKDFLGVVSKTGRTVDGIAQHLWETGGSDNFITRDYRDAIIEILNEPRDEWYVRQKNEVDADSNQNILEQKQKIQEQIDILEDADLSFEDIKNELEANEAMWQQKFEQEGVPKQKSGTFVNKELESDIPKALEYLAKMKELEDGTKKRNMQSKIDEITAKDPKLKKIIENFDTILKQLNYTSNC